MRPLIAHIDTAALAHNLGVVRTAAPQAKAMAVIKANGYGHGLLRVAKALRAADGFAVLSLEDAAQLRAQGLTHPIILLEGFFSADELPDIARLRLRPVIHCVDQVDMLAKTRLDRSLDVLLKVDTGMHRLGVSCKRAPEVLQRLLGLSRVARVMLMTHFACADEPDIGVHAQLERFLAVQSAVGQSADRLSTTLANSAALLRYPQTHGDWVRPGIMLYGVSPFAGQSGESLGLLPVMSLESQIIGVQTVLRGEGLGYGFAFTAERDMRVGIVACGYADGYPRHAGTGTPVLVEQQLTRTLGRVSMDMLCVDLSTLPDAYIGSAVTLWGAGLPVEEVAAAAGTIAYELLTGIAPRVRIEEI